MAGPEPGAGHTASVRLWTHGMPHAEVDAFRDRWQGVLGRLFAS